MFATNGLCCTRSCQSLHLDSASSSSQPACFFVSPWIFSNPPFFDRIAWIDAHHHEHRLSRDHVNTTRRTGRRPRAGLARRRGSHTRQQRARQGQRRPSAGQRRASGARRICSRTGRPARPTQRTRGRKCTRHAQYTGRLEWTRRKHVSPHCPSDFRTGLWADRRRHGQGCIPPNTTSAQHAMMRLPRVPSAACSNHLPAGTLSPPIPRAHRILRRMRPAITRSVLTM